MYRFSLSFSRLSFSLISSILLLSVVTSLTSVHAVEYLDIWKIYNYAVTTSLSNDDRIFNFHYRAINGTIESFQMNKGFLEAKIENQNGTEGSLEIKIPRNFPYTNENRIEPVLIILPNKDVKIDYAMNKTDCFFEYSIPFYDDISQFEFAFTYIPEFGPPHGDKLPPHCLKETLTLDSITKYYSPLKQFQSGIGIENMKCRDALTMMLKVNNDYPICVTLETKQILIERGWAKPV